MAQGPSDTILVAIRITLRIRESNVQNPDPPDRRKFVLSERILVSIYNVHSQSRELNLRHRQLLGGGRQCGELRES